MVRAVQGVLAAVVVLLVYLAVWPTGLQPEPWRPTSAPDRGGVWAPGDELAGVELISTGARRGPEDVAIDAQGRIYAGMADGAILRWQPDGSGPEEVVNTGGRPLGLHVAPDQRLIVADGVLGLFALEVDGTLTRVVDEVDGVPLRFAEDVDVDPDGVAYVTQGSTVRDVRAWELEVIESAPRGRLLRVDLRSGDARTVADGLHFPNGVAIHADGRSVLVVETSRLRVMRVWIGGPVRGAAQVFLDGLPCYPDGISRGPDDRYHLACVSPRKPLLDAVAPYPSARQVIARLPRVLWPRPARHPMVVTLDADGDVVDVLEDPSGRTFGLVTNVQVDGRFMYLGSLSERAFGKLDLQR